MSEFDRRLVGGWLAFWALAVVFTVVVSGV